MKNLIYILLGAGFLAIISSSASGFLTTETSNTLDNLYEETFYIDPENIEITNENIVITLSQQNKNNAINFFIILLVFLLVLTLTTFFQVHKTFFFQG